MAGNSLSLVWDLIARDGASPVFDRVSASADKAAVSTEAASTKTAASLSKIAAVGAATGLAVAVAATKMASDFQKQMLLIQTQAGASADEVRKMGPAILSLAGNVAQAPEALATSLYHVESTGLRGAKALEAVKIAAEGAQVGHADLEETTNALTATIASGMLPATESYSQAMGQLNTIVGAGDMKMSDLNEALASGLLVTTKQYGITLNDVGAALADFGDNNIRGADAATMLRMAVQAIAKPGVGAAGALKEIGLSVQQLQSDEQTGGLNKALTDLHTHLVNSGIDASKWGELLTTAFTKKAGTGLLTLVGTFDRFQQKYKEVSAGADSFGNAWAATTKTASFQANALKDNIDAMAISVGQHLLPAATATMGFLNRDAIPAIKGLASGAADAIHWWSQLPAPIKDVSLALTGLALSNAVGLTGKLSAGVVAVGSAAKSTIGSFGALGDEMALQARLGGMEAASLTEVDRALGGLSGSAARAAGSLSAAQVAMSGGAFAGWDMALSRTVVEGEAAATSVGKMSSAVGALSVRAASAGNGLVNMLGGPWVVATAAAVAGVYGLVKAFTAESDEVKANTQYLLDNMKAEGQVGEQGQAAAQKVADFQGRINDARAAVDNLMSAASDHSGATPGSLGRFGNAVEINKNSLGDLQKALQDAKIGYQEYLNSLTPVDRAQAMVAKDTNDLNVALRDYGPMSAQVAGASSRLQSAQQLLASAQQQANDATKTHLQLLQEQASAELGAVNSGLAAQQAQLSFTSTLNQYNADLKSGAVSAAQLSQEQIGVAQSAIAAAQAAGQQAADQAKANGVTDTANASNAAQLAVLQKVAQQMGVNTPAAINQAIAALQGATVTSGSLTDAIGKLGLTNVNESSRFRSEWGNNVQVLKGATDAQIRDLQGLGFTVMTLPNHEIVVSASTSAARNAITQLTNDYAQYSINVGLKIGTSTFARAGGGPVWGAGTSTSDSIPAMLSDREWVIKAASADKYGPKAMASVNAGTATIIPHLAGGGTLADMFLNAKVGISPASLSAASASIKGQLTSFSSAAAVGGAGGAARWANVVLQALAMMGQSPSLLGTVLRRMNQESGGNPNAINLTDSNARAGYPSQGLMQTIPSTFAAYHYPGTSNNIDDPLANVLASMRYALARYGSLSAAYNKAGGYKLGTNFVPSDQLAMLHKGEAVVPASQNQGAPYVGGPLTIQLDGPATTDLLEGRAVQVVTSYATATGNRRAFSG